MRKTVESYLFLVPALVFLIAFSYFPFLRSVWTSFFQSKTVGDKHPVFIGFDNYTHLAGDEIFWKSIKNNLIFTVGTVPTSIILGFFIAILIHRASRLSTLYRILFFYPNILPTVAIANIWLFILNPDFGLLHQLMQLFKSSGWNPLGDPQWVMPALIAITIWKHIGYFMLFYLAGLQQLPKDVMEAAELDGASRWRSLWSITVPLLAPTTLFTSIIALVDSFLTMDTIYILTNGGPYNATIMPLFYIYQIAFQNWNIGLASTLTVILAIILLTIMLFNFFVFDRKVHYN
ncbi:sugar ABC transporter permease [Paenibacillus filicis]|uniref:Sugar ABC transporter permease n=1 Tax=Paenibacillus gyeongsangnamensis TaxID=3388067 RepID=A0ABT4QEZ5_9BACL|nr:sugar ABC transporter permease [Paenibacillus filicis]MCZ8515454.1 sugar ABC transporter permease [Paenibacillus filicis]